MKKWIEFVEDNTIWRWNGKCFLSGHKSVDKLGFIGKDVAQPADLLGWKIAFAESQGFIINVSMVIAPAEKQRVGYGSMIYGLDGEEHYFEVEGSYEDTVFRCYYAKTYQEAFDAAWDKFLEIIK